MDKTLLIVVVSFQAIFAVLCTFVWSGNNRLLAYVDLVVSTANPLLDWYFVSQYALNGGLSPGQISSEVLLLGYKVSRVWSKAIFVETASQAQSTVLDSFHLIWCTSSAKLVARMLPDLTKHWDRLVAKWGDDAPKGMWLRVTIHCITFSHSRRLHFHWIASPVCQISIYVTDSKANDV